MLYPERCEDLSVYYWLVEKFSSAPFVNIEDGFPEKDLNLPLVSVEWNDLEGLYNELGNRKTVKQRTYYLDVFTLNKSQRDEFAYKIFNDLDDGIPVFNYNEGFPPSVTPTQTGTLVPLRRRIKKIDPVAEDPDELYYRAVVIVNVTVDKF